MVINHLLNGMILQVPQPTILWSRCKHDLNLFSSTSLRCCLKPVQLLEPVSKANMQSAVFPRLCCDSLQLLDYLRGNLLWNATNAHLQDILLPTVWGLITLDIQNPPNTWWVGVWNSKKAWGSLATVELSHLRLSKSHLRHQSISVCSTPLGFRSGPTAPH